MSEYDNPYPAAGWGREGLKALRAQIGRDARALKLRHLPESYERVKADLLGAYDDLDITIGRWLVYMSPPKDGP